MSSQAQKTALTSLEPITTRQCLITILHFSAFQRCSSGGCSVSNALRNSKRLKALGKPPRSASEGLPLIPRKSGCLQVALVDCCYHLLDFGQIVAKKSVRLVLAE